MTETPEAGDPASTKTDASRVGAAQDVDVRALASGGAGVADLPDGRVAFIPRTAPGDRVRMRVEKRKPRWALGSLQRVLDAGPDRVDAPCPLYASCGGCQLQHVSYEAQLAWKGRFIADALERIGKLENVVPPVVRPSPLTLRYRNRITYTLRRLRDGHVVAGFHALGRPAHVIDVAGECLLPDERLGAVWTALRAGWGENARRLPDGGRLQLMLRLSAGGVDLVIDGGAADWDASDLRAAVPALGAIWHAASDAEGSARLVGPDPASAVDSSVAGNAPVTGTSFTQVNSEASALLAEHVLEVVGDPPVPDGSDRPRVVDAYCGTGAYGTGLAGRGWSVLGIEVDGAAAEVARASADAFDVIVGRVEDELAAALPADVLVVNPPRSGLEDGVPDVIRTSPPQTLVYVSCDPGTLARDLSRLSDVYELTGLEAFDLFPQTAHVETVAVLARKQRSP